MSVTAAKGFVASGIACGVKASGDLDLALVATEDGRPVNAAGVFTSNLAKAAPVLVSQAHLQSTGGRAAAVVLNSGNANAATGGVGRGHAEGTCALVATAIGCAFEEVLVCSTGLIGIPLPIEAIESGVTPLLAARRADGDGDAARAIMTTDTRDKQVVVRRDGYVVGGMAKGAAMLSPNMATMLAVLTTDAAVEPARLLEALRAGVRESFNEMTIDGCTSTNDTVLLLASGRGATPDAADFAAAVAEACADLAGQMVADAEGATKLARIRINGAASNDDARRAARRVAESQLVKCSLYGQDPYWGRIVSEIGSSGAAFDPDRVSVSYGGVAVCGKGIAWIHDEAAVKEHMAGRDIEIVADLGLGEGTAMVITSDLTHAYIDENMGTS